MKLLWLTCTSATIVLFSISCTSPKNETPATPKSFVVQNVNPQGHLDLSLLFSQIREFPEDTLARQFTESVIVTNATPREALNVRIVKGGFVFEELPALKSDLIKEYSSAQQTSCDVGSTLTLTTPDGNSDTFVIKSCSSTKISIEDSTNANFGYTYEFLGPQELMITKRYEAIDSCLHPSDDEKRKNPTIETRKMIRWGRADTVSLATEKVSKEMLWVISKGIAQVPESITNMSSGDLVEISSADLKTLHETALRPDIHICPGLHIPRPNEPETSTEPQASPLPEPNYPIAPGGSPEPTPAPLIPEPTLAPAPIR